MKKLFVSLLVVYSVFFSNNAYCQWVQTNGPWGACSKALAVNNRAIFTGTFGNGVFVSSNKGATWTAVNSGLTNTIVLSLATNGSAIFAGTQNGVFLSINNGASWTAVNSGLTNKNVWSLAVCGASIFAATDGGGVFLSTNNGASWTAVNSGLSCTTVLSIAMSGNNIFAGTDGGGVFLYTNSGTGWTAINSGLTSMNIVSFALSGGIIFAGSYQGVWRRPLSDFITTIDIAGTGFDWMYFGDVTVPPEGVKVRVKNPDYRYGMMFTARNNGASDSIVVEWNGVMDQNRGDCQSRSVNLNGNGAQINNVCASRSSDNSMCVTLRSKNASTYSVHLEIFNWRNGGGCASK